MKSVSTIGAAKFKEQCLSLLDSLEPDGLVITKHGRPVARVLPYPKHPRDLIGSLKGKIRVHGEIFSTGETWHANERADG